jgi:regulator of cell morphogenesis and NO signaling
MMLNDEKTVGEIAAEFQAAAWVFEKYHIDYSCGGKHPLVEACRVVGARARDVMEEVESASGTGPASDTPDWSTAPLWQLIQHILDKHHAWLRQELLLIEQMMDGLIDVHGTKRPYSILPLRRIFICLQSEMEEHMNREEHILFPAIVELESVPANGGPVARCVFDSVRNLTSMMEQEHYIATQYLDEMRDLTYGYDLPENACHSFRVLYEELQTLEADMRTHIHLENNILFPHAVRLERERQMTETSPPLALTDRKTRQVPRRKLACIPSEQKEQLYAH